MFGSKIWRCITVTGFIDKLKLIKLNIRTNLIVLKYFWKKKLNIRVKSSYRQPLRPVSGPGPKKLCTWTGYKHGYNSRIFWWIKLIFLTGPGSRWENFAKNANYYSGVSVFGYIRNNIPNHLTLKKKC